MEANGSPASATAAAKKPVLTPKAVINQKFGKQACYRVEEVQESTVTACPGLSIQQKGPCLFRCTLKLPEFHVVSEVCRKKKDAEQSAAEKALEKLGLHPHTNYDLTPDDPWDSLVVRLFYLFGDEFVSAIHPLSGHFRAALHREGDLNGLVPISVLAVCDSKLSNLCKSIDPSVESNPLLAISVIVKVAARLSETIATSEEQLWMKRRSSYPSDVIQSLSDSTPESFKIQAVHIPYLLEKPVESLSMHVPPNGYYMDVIAQELCVIDTCQVLLSRTIGKSSSEMRIYFCAPTSCILNQSTHISNTKEAAAFEGSFNVRASYLSGQDMYGNAILASIGYTWKSKDLYHEDVSLRAYYRTLISKIPSGLYKLSREAALAADLPLAFTTKTNWRGAAPRDLLCMFCRQHRLPEPVFSPMTYTLESSSELPGSCKRLKVEELEQAKLETNIAIENSGEAQCAFRCEVKIFSRYQDLIIVCAPKEYYKKQYDALQTAALKILLWLDSFFKEPDMPVQKLMLSGDALHIQFSATNFFKVFALCSPVHKVQQRIVTEVGCRQGLESENHPYPVQGSKVRLFNIEGPESGVSPANGSVACINYTVSLVSNSEDAKHIIENGYEFEFEVGTGAVIPHLEEGVTQISIGQCASFQTELHANEFVLAADGDSAKTLSVLSSNLVVEACFLEYSISLLKVTEPLEDRMEQALFSPPLSKQRVEFALQYIKESSAKALVDFGCGSGSLLGSLLDYPTDLENIVGVDISQKGLTRAAKVVHSKLGANLVPGLPSRGIQSAVLYEGSITEFDSRVYGFDMGTCLEVIEHMEEDQACLFGDVVLSYFCPRILIVSTPNYEYNVILQGSNLTSREEDPDQSLSFKFRNHDHKFEWTREQFNSWATDLAKRHNYSVEFSGVGGSGDLEPGFASQIAVFRRNDLTSPPNGDNQLKNIDVVHRYDVLWEWNSSK